MNKIKALMGGGSKDEKTQSLVPAQRRRLSVSQVDANAVKALAEKGNPEATRGVVQMMKQNGTLQVSQGGGSKHGARRGSFVLGSVTSAQQDSFDDKNVVTEGEEVINHQTLKSRGIGVRCKKGLKPEAPNQDSFALIHYDGEFDLYGVFDGHGAAGHDISNFVREFLPKVFIADPNRMTNTKQAFVDSFRKVQDMIEQSTQLMDPSSSGTTCTLAYKEAGKDELHVAHCGDSRAMMLYEKSGKAVGVEVTEDHKPNLPGEKQRIEAAGGCVIFDGFYNHRAFKRGAVYPGLNMSRAFGDVLGHKEAGIVETPDYKVIKLSGSHEYLCFTICSDGVWEFIDGKEAGQIISRHRQPDGKIDPLAAADDLAKQSWNRWMEDTEGEISDDITVLIKLIEKDW